MGNIKTFSKFIGKHVIDMNETDDGSFDILQIQITSEKNIYQAIAYGNYGLYIITCSELFFRSIKVIGKSMYEVKRKD